MAIVPCTPVPIVFGIVQYDAGEFTTAYPEFIGLAAQGPAQNFAIATLLLNNTCGSRVKNAVERQTLLYLMTAHLTMLYNGTNDGAGNIVPALGIVGRVSDASEGEVSVSAQFDVPATVTNAWLAQTKYGATYLAMAARYRTMLYVPAQGSVPAPWGPGCGC